MTRRRLSAGARYRTITLSDGAPARLDEATWPILAEATVGGAVAKIRRGPDGRHVVYGIVDGDGRRRAGYVVEPGGDLADAARALQAELRVDGLAVALLADLPARDL